MGKYFKDKTEVYKVRLTKEQSEYVGRLSKALNCSKSHAIRCCIDMLMIGEKQNENK